MGNKRDFLKKLSFLTIGGVVGSSMAPVLASEKSASSFFAPKKVVGLQIYSLGQELTKDVPAGLKKVAEIGYKNVELAGYGNRKVYGYEPAEFRKIADAAGINITGSHVNPPMRKYTNENKDQIADFWKQTFEDHAKLGVRSVVQPGMPEINTHDDAKMVCEVFNKAGEIAKSAGIKWGYHNHSGEFKRISKDVPVQTGEYHRQKGDCVYDLLIQGTDPNLVFFEMDVYWAVMGQADPIEYFDKYPTRFPILHIKDREVLGQSGMMNFETIFKKAYANGLSEYFVELEKVKANVTQFQGVKECYDYLVKAPFVK
jgi:sugar phosphate isomerase/epimerase